MGEWPGQMCCYGAEGIGWDGGVKEGDGLISGFVGFASRFSGMGLTFWMMHFSS